MPLLDDFYNQSLTGFLWKILKRQFPSYEESWCPLSRSFIFHLAHSKCTINGSHYYSYCYYFGNNSNGAKLIQGMSRKRSSHCQYTENGYMDGYFSDSPHIFSSDISFSSAWSESVKRRKRRSESWEVRGLGAGCRRSSFSEIPLGKFLSQSLSRPSEPSPVALAFKELLWELEKSFPFISAPLSWQGCWFLTETALGYEHSLQHGTVQLFS